jgi:uncharacterized protein YecT (DUF1311 family)
MATAVFSQTTDHEQREFCKTPDCMPLDKSSDSKRSDSESVPVEAFANELLPMKDQKLAPDDRVRQSHKLCGDWNCLIVVDGEAEELLQHHYENALFRAKKVEAVETLSRSQDHWVSYVDKFCEAVSEPDRGWTPAYVRSALDCKIGHTADRIEELNELYGHEG